MVAYTRWGAIWSGGNRGLMNNILREEWGKKGLIITDNVLTTYVNGADGVMAGGVSTFDAMLPHVTNQLPKYKKDPVMVTSESLFHRQFRRHERSGAGDESEDQGYCHRLLLPDGSHCLLGAVPLVNGPLDWEKTGV